MESCLSLEQKINVKRPKLIAEEKNEVWEKIRFFSKKSTFFENLKFLKKNSSWSCFFWKFHSTSNCLRITSSHNQSFSKVSLESQWCIFVAFQCLNAANHFPEISPHLEAMKGWNLTQNPVFFDFENSKSPHLKTKITNLISTCGTCKNDLKLIAPLMWS